MSPISSRNDVLHGSNADLEFPGQHCTWEADRVEVANHLDLLGRQLVTAIANPSRRAERVLLERCPTLAGHVSRVVGRCAQEQVIRSHTRRVVAVVADKEPFRDRPIGDLPRKAVRVSGIGSVFSPDHSIATRHGGGRPSPTISAGASAGRLVDLSPKAVSGGYPGILAWHRILHWFGVWGRTVLTSRPSNFSMVSI